MTEQHSGISADNTKEDSELPELAEPQRLEGLDLAAHLIETTVRGRPLTDGEALSAANALAMVEVAKAAQQAAAALEALNETLKDEDA